MSTAAVEIHTPPAEGMALVPAQSPRLGLLRPLAQPAEIIQSQEATRQLVQEALKEHRDYGVIPGVDKPSLLKPGAERINLAFGCAARFKVVEREVEHDRVVEWVKRKKKWNNAHKDDKAFEWVEERGTAIGLYRYVMECEIVHRESGHVVASCVGSCSTMESKYVDRPRDSENTVIKMAEKRCFVGATLVAFGLSEQFTQDVEDLPREAIERDGTTSAEPEARCPTCKGRMWDNREKKGNPKAPDFKCRDRSCAGVYWPGQWPPKPADAPTVEGEQRLDPTPSSTPSSAPTSPAGSPPKPATTTSATSSPATPLPASTAQAAPPATTGEMDLHSAKRLRLMGLTTSWDNHGGKALEECPDKVLRAALRFFKEKIREQANPRMEEQVAAIALVMADREKNSPQESLELVGARAPASDGDFPAALEDQDDDLPF